MYRGAADAVVVTGKRRNLLETRVKRIKVLHEAPRRL